jgi:hypothetical protein
MNDSLRPHRLFDLWRRRAEEPALSEPGDVGTAFGLELSLLPEEESSATARVGAPGGTLWWRRLMRWSSGTPAPRD